MIEWEQEVKNACPTQNPIDESGKKGIGERTRCASQSLHERKSSGYPEDSGRNVRIAGEPRGTVETTRR
jgi:hypothetical protein